jgi:hypothetical protein
MVLNAAAAGLAPLANASVPVGTLSACTVWLVHDYVFDTFTAGAPAPHSLLRALSPWGVLVASLPLCFFGYYAIRAVLAIAAFGAGALGVVRLTQLGNADVSCDGVTLAVVAAGGACALVAAFLTRPLALLLGAAAVCGVVGAVFAVCGAPCDAALWPGAPRVVGFTLVPFWTSMVAGALVGAFATRLRHREMLAVMAAVLGGYGVALSTRSLVADAGHVLPDVAFLATIGACAATGLGAQYAVVRYRRAARRAREAARAEKKRVEV